MTPNILCITTHAQPQEGKTLEKRIECRRIVASGRLATDFPPDDVKNTIQNFTNS